MAKSNISTTVAPAEKNDLARPDKNPHFAHAGRPAYEIGRLLRDLPADYVEYSERPADQHLIAIAAGAHARNAGEVVLNGLQALGAAIKCAANNDGAAMDCLADLGALVEHLAIELELLNELEFVGETAEKTLTKGGA